MKSIKLIKLVKIVEGQRVNLGYTQCPTSLTIYKEPLQNAHLFLLFQKFWNQSRATNRMPSFPFDLSTYMYIARLPI